jgi:NADH-quinone oxidoreductase subunit J
MDYVLLAATALGAIGLYLMLPRERAPLVRLGGLLGAMALAGFFLFLVRLGDRALGGAAVESRPPVYFYLFAAIMIAGAVGVVCQPRPVYAALYFVLVTLAGAGLFVLLLAEFMAIVLIIIYAGAILVTYVFVIMLASQGSAGGGGGKAVAPAYDRRASGGCIAVAVSFALVGAITQVLLPSGNAIAQAADYQGRSTVSQDMHGLMVRSLSDEPAATAGAPRAALTPPSGVQLLGASLYSQYAISLELAGILLTIALVGAVVIARKNAPERQPLGSGKLPAQ